jgi:hypothetical protein
VRIKIVRALLWMIRRFSFSVVLNDNAVTVYQWEQSRVTGLRDWFESPNVAGELDRESVSTVLQRERPGLVGLANPDQLRAAGAEIERCG